MLLARFFKDRKAGVAPLLALGIIPLVGTVGAAVDYSRASSVRAAMQAAGDATAIRPYDDDWIMVNLSVWRSLPELWDFVYASQHLDLLRRRREWFERMEAYLALWWVPAGTLPSVEEAKQRLERLRSDGPGPEAFTFRAPWPPPP